MNKLDIAFFGFCLTLTVASGFLQLFGLLAYWANILALVAAVLGGSLITLESVKELLHKHFGVDILASFAIWISVLVGEALAAAVVVIMLNGGTMLEEYIAGRSSKAIEKLMKSAPLTARVHRDGKEIEVPLNDVKVDGMVYVNPGEKIPVDGIIEKGNGLVNQAIITGESVPLEKFVGTTVYANTLLENGTLDIRVTKKSGDTIFAHIIRQVEEAQLRKAPVERIADRYARWFAPIILSVAVITQLVTGNVISTAAVLVISCPCALTLATPIAVAAGLGNSARDGVLIRGGTYLEEVGRCNVAILDKTGTITLGKPEVVDVKALGKNTVIEVLSIAGTAEQRSEHSLAKAVLDEVKKYEVSLAEPEELEVKPGYGIIAKNSGHTLLVGNMNLMKEHSVVFLDEAALYMERETALGHTVVAVAKDGEAVGLISIADTLRVGVKDSIAKMRQAGLEKVVMLSGDNLAVAQEVAREVGIDEVHANLLPEDKVKYVHRYREQGKCVIVIGDGINDAPALASANVGIAMGVTGTDVAMETAGIVLMADDLSKVARTVTLSRRVLSVVKQNVIFAMAVNITGLILSTQGLVNPVLASVIHEGNALIVAFNSLRLFGRSSS
ncbi:MAG: Zn2+/Cd2+-exporting ATPase [Thermoproteota archaeon]|nr:Zn2+/Cd2+-exporting ATPase [Thermoproteota archaeon]